MSDPMTKKEYSIYRCMNEQIADANFAITIDGVVEVLVEFLDLLHVLLTVHHVAAHALLLLVAKAIAFDRKVGPGHIALHTHGSVNFSAINFHVCLLAVNFDFVITHLHCSRKLGFIALLSKDCTGECNEND